MSSVSELRQVAKVLGIRGYSVAKKADLITLIEKKQNPAVKAEVKAEVKADAPAVIDMVKAEVKAEAPVKAKAQSKKQVAKAAFAESVAVVAVEPKEVSKRMNEWNSFLADYRKEHNVSLRQAMAEAKEAYGKHKEESRKTYTSPDCP
jgi:hypothetical protein